MVPAATSSKRVVPCDRAAKSAGTAAESEYAGPVTLPARPCKPNHTTTPPTSFSTAASPALVSTSCPTATSCAVCSAASSINPPVAITIPASRIHES